MCLMLQIEPHRPTPRALIHTRHEVKTHILYHERELTKQGLLGLSAKHMVPFWHDPITDTTVPQ